MKTICPATIITIPLAAFCAVLALVSCGKKQQVAAPAVAPTASEVTATEIVDAVAESPKPAVEHGPSPEERMADAKRLSSRSMAIYDLISAHQKVSRYEGDAEQYRAILKAPRDAAEIATVQDDLSETRNDIRDQKSEILNLEKRAEELSKRGDPSYQVEIATFLADLAETENAAARTKRARAENAGELAETLHKMQMLSPDEVLAGNYPKPPGR